MTLNRLSGKYESVSPRAPETTNGSVMHGLSLERNPIDILETGKSISDVIDGKIRQLYSVGSEEPFYVVNLDNILERHLQWISLLPRVKPFYAVKCNNTTAVLKMLSALDTGFDCASKAEIELALSLGVKPDDIIYAHTTKPLSHIRYACAHRVNLMTFDNEEELLKISLVHPQAKLVIRIAVDDSKSMVRLSPKFGARLPTVRQLLERARELNLEVVGVSFHVGSGCTKSSAFRQAIEDARCVFDVASFLGFQMRLLDIGGGFSKIGDFQEKFEEFSQVINGSLDEFFPPVSGLEVIAEPGRYYVESAFTLAVNVIAKRVVVEDRASKCTDGAESCPERLMMYYINDGVYGSMSCITFDPAHSKLEPYPHRAVKKSEPRYRSIIWGPTCDSIDKITESYWIPELYVGDWLLVDNMGAYTVSVTTDFNSFEKAHIYTVVTAETWLALNLSRAYDTVH
ncbi:ornithine decarboxylase-like isoform X1 [Oreochromis aureus]|uniref:Orn/DAP/Arg decarboxylase 2 N-terminal domain-containing protein n=2 Tax=Oreochromis aureus TaxID=47969 RepID=A0A668RDG2_OREAU|nr:ornithine decarboxylase-like isoform X1 [Oreochromis aureus]XP_039466670.1 ornithine decarboxylase-like isoform X1 [Oreochromis aureus]